MIDFHIRPQRQRMLLALPLAAMLAACGGGGGSPDGQNTQVVPAKPASPVSGNPPAADTTPPTAPGGLSAAAVSPTQVNLTWTASTDNVGVVSYQIFRDGAQAPLAATVGTTFSDTSVTAATSHSYVVRALDAAGNISGPSTAAQVMLPTQLTILPGPTETRSVLVMHQIFTDTPPCYASAAQMRDVFFDGKTSVNAFFKESSYGKFVWTGDVLMCQLNYPSTDSNHDATADCQAAARTQGYAPEIYNTLAYIAEDNAMSVSYGNSVKAGHCELAWIIHELGHQIGLGHAASDWGNDGAQVDEYGDHADVMGWGYWTFNAPHRVLKGWLTPTVLTADGTFTLAPIEAASDNRVYKFIPPSGDPYFFGYYQPIGYDSLSIEADGKPTPQGAIGSGPYSAAYVSGVNVYRSDGNGFTRIVRQIGDGESYAIPGTPVVIRQLSHGADGVTFAVTGLGNGG